MTVSLNVALGVAAGATITDASSTAAAEVAGLDAGEGRDTMLNEGAVQAWADAVAKGRRSPSSCPTSRRLRCGEALDFRTADAVGLRDADSAAAAPLRTDKHKTNGGRGSSCGHDGHGSATATPTSRRPRSPTAPTSRPRRRQLHRHQRLGALFGYSLGDTGNSATARRRRYPGQVRDDAILNEAKLTAIASATASGFRWT